MPRPRGIAQRRGLFPDRMLQSQIDNILKTLMLFPFLGIISTDPTTTGWGAKDICWWVNNSTATAVTIKYWNGSATKTISVA